MQIKNPSLYSKGLYSSKPISRVLFCLVMGNFYHLSGPVITNRFKQPTHPNDLPYSRYGSEQLRFQDLFGFSTPEVYRHSRSPGYAVSSYLTFSPLPT